MMVAGVILFLKSFYLNDYHSVGCLLNVLQRKGLDGKSFFVNEVSFENVAKDIGFIHVFENGEK